MDGGVATLRETGLGARSSRRRGETRGKRRDDKEGHSN
jgi:hypothetical protein